MRVDGELSNEGGELGVGAQGPGKKGGASRVADEDVAGVE